MTAKQVADLEELKKRGAALEKQVASKKPAPPAKKKAAFYTPKKGK